MSQTEIVGDLATEAEEQATFVHWLEMKGLKFTAIPNSTYTPSKFQKIQNYNLGLRKGLPDLLIILPDALLFIEMKRRKKWKISEEQKSWIEELNKIDNVGAFVCCGAEEAISTVEKYLTH